MDYGSRSIIPLLGKAYAQYPVPILQVTRFSIDRHIQCSAEEDWYMSF